MKKFYDSYEHFFYSVVKKAKEKIGKPIVDRIVKSSLSDIYKYDELFNPVQSLCSKLYFEIYYADELTKRDFKHMLINYRNLVKSYKETDLWKESDKLYTIDMPKTDNFNQLMERSKGAFGIYFLYDSNMDIVYIGKSISNLSERSLLSAIDKKSQYIQHYFAKTKSDVTIYELYYINKYKPLFNKGDKEDDNVTFDLPKLQCTDVIKIYADLTGR